MFNHIPLTCPNTPLLDQASMPDALRQLPITACPRLAREVREYLLWCTGQTGGHFGAGLGVIELTIALHYVYKRLLTVSFGMWVIKPIRIKF
jgi:1-deoxy-D-xylulose-5-phosphate synthase